MSTAACQVPETNAEFVIRMRMQCQRKGQISMWFLTLNEDAETEQTEMEQAETELQAETEQAKWSMLKLNAEWLKWSTLVLNRLKWS